jgi:glyoxylase-like metal-dependent hydrolase (beta-lactamase superfamily II)
MLTRAILVAGALASMGVMGAIPAQNPVPTADIAVRGLTASDFPRTRRLAPNVYSYEQIDPTKRAVTANNLIVITSAGVLVADGQGTVDNTRRLVADIGALTSQPIRYVVVGSEHGDHTGGNTAFSSTATFVAHPFSQGNLARQAGAARGRANAPAVVVPTETVAGKRVLNMGGTEIDILFLGRAHTGGDLEVYLPREKILYMSEVFSNHIFPSMANGYPTEWIETLKKAEQIDADWYVPAHGFVDSAATLKDQERQFRSSLERIVAEGTRLHERHVPLESAPASAVFEPFDAWTRAANNATAALARVYAELDGTLR